MLVQELRNLGHGLWTNHCAPGIRCDACEQWNNQQRLFGAIKTMHEEVSVDVLTNQLFWLQRLTLALGRA